jgi:nitrogen fixation protein FixH
LTQLKSSGSNSASTAYSAVDSVKQRTLNGYHVGSIFVAFFAVILAVNLTMAWFASSSWTGLVVKNSYVASQQYNEKIAAAKLQQARGWKLKFDYSHKVLSFWLSDGDDKPVFIENIVARIGRPVSEAQDEMLKLSHMGKGRYRAAMELSQGIWSFQLQGDGKQPYHIEGRFTVSENGIGTLQ